MIKVEDDSQPIVTHYEPENLFSKSYTLNNRIQRGRAAWSLIAMRLVASDQIKCHKVIIDTSGCKGKERLKE